MGWIRTIGPSEADGALKAIYDSMTRPDRDVTTAFVLHSLRPHSLEGHMDFCRRVMRHDGNVVPQWFLEALGAWTSHLSGCTYWTDHHCTVMRRLLNDEARYREIKRSFDQGQPDQAFTGRELAAMHYARKLIETPGAMAEGDVARLRAAGWDDGEILEINQVVAYVAYATRTVQGLGGTADRTSAPSPVADKNPDTWNHP